MPGKNHTVSASLTQGVQIRITLLERRHVFTTTLLDLVPGLGMPNTAGQRQNSLGLLDPKSLSQWLVGATVKKMINFNPLSTVKHSDIIKIITLDKMSNGRSPLQALRHSSQ